MLERAVLSLSYFSPWELPKAWYFHQFQWCPSWWTQTHKYLFLNQRWWHFDLRYTATYNFSLRGLFECLRKEWRAQSIPDYFIEAGSQHWKHKSGRLYCCTLKPIFWSAETDLKRTFLLLSFSAQLLGRAKFWWETFCSAPGSFG